MGNLKEKVLQAKGLPDEAYVDYIYDIFQFMYTKGWRHASSTHRKISSFRDKRNKEHKDEFYAEVRRLRKSPYIKNPDLRQIKKMMPKHVEQLVNTFGITLRDIAEFTVSDIDEKTRAWNDLRRIVKIINNDSIAPDTEPQEPDKDYNIYVSKKPQSYKENRNYHFLYHKEINLEEAKKLFINTLDPEVKKLFTPSGICYIKDKK